jgi:hypothetical protein
VQSGGVQKIALEGKRVIVIEEEPIERRDFTYGKATKIFNNLKEISTIATTREVIKYIQRKL